MSTLPKDSAKKRRIAEPESDKMDPVEKLLSLTCNNNDLLVQLNESESQKNEQASATASAASHPNISYNFRKVMNDNLRRHYSRLRRSPMEIHNDNSSFSILNRASDREQASSHVPRAHVPQIPFFKNVNFNSSPTYGYKVEDYIHYDEDDENEDPLTTDSEPLHTDTEDDQCSPVDPLQQPKQPKQLSAKMSFHYRQNDNFNFSLTGEQKDGPNDGFKFLNKRSVISGKASEMIGTPNFLVSDFFF